MKIHYTGTEVISDIGESIKVDKGRFDSEILSFFMRNGHFIETVDQLWLLDNKEKNAHILDFCITEWEEISKQGGKIIYRQPCFSVLLRLYKPTRLNPEPNISKCESSVFKKFSIEIGITMLKNCCLH